MGIFAAKIKHSCSVKQTKRKTNSILYLLHSISANEGTCFSSNRCVEGAVAPSELAIAAHMANGTFLSCPHHTSHLVMRCFKQQFWGTCPIDACTPGRFCKPRLSVHRTSGPLFPVHDMGKLEQHYHPTLQWILWAAVHQLSLQSEDSGPPCWEI